MASLRSRILRVLETVRRESRARVLLVRDLQKFPPKGGGPLRIVALGKSARGLAEAALEELGERVESLLCIGPEGLPSIDDPRVQEMTGDHPVPTHRSFQCGKAALNEAARARSDGASVMVLLSGGASSLCEYPRDGVSAEELTASHRECVASGKPIEIINAERARLSMLKAGGLSKALGPSLVDVRVLVDIPSGELGIVGSGPCTSPHYAGTMRSIGEPRDLLAMAHHALAEEGLLGASVIREEPRPWDLDEITDAMVAHIGHGRGAWMTAGEVGVPLPKEVLGTHEGGRAQHLGLHVATRLRGNIVPWAIVTWASDGRDGFGGAGALITSDQPSPVDPHAARHAIASWQSGRYLASIGSRLKSFASQTNLTDLYMVLRPKHHV